MHWFFADETNVEPGQGTFFIYGGLIATPRQIVEIHDSVAQVREKYGFDHSDQFKFQTASRPSGMRVENWTSAKREALERAQKIGIKMIVYVVHHGIAKGSGGKEATAEYALNTLVAHFDMKYLAQEDAYGALCIDRLDEKFGYRYMRERFQQPLSLPDGRSPRLERVIHYSMSCDGASHMSSLEDLAIGGFRCCANAAMGSGRDVVATEMMKPIAKMMWSRQGDGKNYIGGYGLVKRPLIVKVAEYQNDYDSLTSMLTRYSQEKDS